MKLRHYLSVKGISVADCQTGIGVKSRNTVYRYLRGDVVPEPDVMTRIIAWSNGDVTPNDFFDLPETTPTEPPAIEPVGDAA